MSVSTLVEALRKDKDGKLLSQMQGGHIDSVLDQFGITDATIRADWKKSAQTGKLKERINTMRLK